MTAGCATEHGVTESTRCLDHRDYVACFETCEPTPSGCPDPPQVWAPLAFEAGGVCANEFDPDGWR